MKTVTLDVRSKGSALTEARRAWKAGEAQKTARISFSSPQLLLKVLSAKRLAIVEALCGAGPLTVRAAAKLVGRDVKAVHGDITALVKAGILTREENGFEFPYSAVNVEFSFGSRQQMQKAG